MAEEPERYRVHLFDGSNFNNWKFRMETLLNEMELLKFIEKPVTHMVEFLDGESLDERKKKETLFNVLDKCDRKCRSQIIQRIADSHLEYVKDKCCAYDIWKSLSDTFERKGVASQLLIRKSLLTMKFDTGHETLANHFLKFDKIVRQLRSTGATLEETDIVCHLLLTMPSEYNTVVTAIETLSMENINLSFVKNRLLDEESKWNDSRKKSHSEVNPLTAFASRPGKSFANKNKESRTKGNGRFPFRCHFCGLKGHKKSKCYKFLSQSESKSANVIDKEPTITTEESCMFPAIIGDSSEDKIKWYLDSGATEHLIDDNVLLQNVKRLESPVKIKVAKSGIYLYAKHVGELNVISYVNGVEIPITIKNVLSVPDLKFNLLSVSVLEHNGFRVIFENGKGTIDKNGKLIAVAKRTNFKLYELNVKQAETCVNTCLNEENMVLWHKRLGHLNFESMKHLKQQVDGIESEFKKPPLHKCEMCIEGKQTQLPHKHERTRAKRPLQLIHSDLFGPVNPTSHDGKRYVLTFIDDYTHFTVAYTMKYKSELFHYFKIYEAMAGAFFNNRLSRFRCDNGGEYISSEIKEFFEKNGIQFEFTIRYTPQQNGVAERMNRSIIERARSMILGCNLGKVFWSEAVLTAVYLINRSPTTALEGKIPAQIWYGRKQNLTKLKVFGCTAFLKIPKELVGGKFDSKSKKCYFVGYCINGYRLWCPQERKIYFGHDVIFDEHKFIFDRSNNDFWNHSEDDDENDQVTVSKNLIQNQDSGDLNGVRKSNRTVIRPKYLEDYTALAFNAEAYIDDVPQTFDEVQFKEDKDEWLQAISEEISALEKNETWFLEELPSGKRTINCKWIFKIKRDKDGNIERYKARLVAKGCSQRKGFDYNETYAPVARMTTMRTLMAIVIQEDLIVYQMDVKNAFLHGKLKEEIYMEVPPGYNKFNKDLVCKLNKSIYGLKQASRAWNEMFDKVVKQLGLIQANADKCLYVGFFDTELVYLLLYVDDILLIGRNNVRLENIKQALKNNFDMTDLGNLQTFLGINFKREEEKIYMSQTPYILNLLKRFNMENCNPVSTPMEIKMEENCEEKIDAEIPYRELVGCLMYLMITTRPDICMAVNYFSRQQSNPTETHWRGLKRILRYLKGSANLSLVYKRQASEVLVGYTDADWGGNLDRKSTSGYLFKCFGNTICWTTKKQSTVAQSSTEAEYIALAMGATELLWLKNLLFDLEIGCEEPIIIYEDNQSCIHLLNRWEHCRLKHVDIKYNFVRDLNEKKIITVKYINTTDQLADMLTKALPKAKLDKLLLGILY